MSSSTPTPSTADRAARGSWLDRVSRSPLFPAVLQAAGLVALLALILAGWGIGGVPGRGEAGQLLYTNLATLGFWVVWFMALVLLLPAVGRLWCTVCPVGWCNDLLARVGLRRAYPRRLRNMVAMAALMLGLTLAAELFGLNRFPDRTALLLVALLAAAAGAGLVFSGRVFCRYWCPVGGMAGLHARLAPAEVGARDLAICRACEEKPCHHGGTRRYRLSWGGGQRTFDLRRPGCPAFVFPPAARRSGACLLCTQCFKNCPYDNMRWGARPLLAGLWRVDTRDRSEALLVVVLTGVAFYRLARFWTGLREVVDRPAEAVASAWQAVGPAAYQGLKLLAGFAGWPLLFFVVLAAAVKVAAEVRVREVPDGAAEDAPGRPAEALTAPGDPALGPLAAEEEAWAVRRHTLWGYLASYSLAFLPLAAGAYGAFAAVKLNEKLGYLPLALGDPAGVRTWLAINELQILPAPQSLLPLEAVRWVALALVAAGAAASLWSVGGVGAAAYGAGAPGARRGTPVVRAGVLLLGALMLWCVRVWLFRG